jgi:hypothetical protein
LSSDGFLRTILEFESEKYTVLPLYPCTPVPFIVENPLTLKNGSDVVDRFSNILKP